MAPKRTSIFVGPRLAEYLDARTDAEDAKVDPERPTGSRSSLLERLADRYLEVVRRARPLLSTGEWSLICDACNGAIFDPAAHMAIVWAEVADAIRLNSLDEKWSVDGKALVARLTALDYAGLLAVADVVERFWQDTDNTIEGILAAHTITAAARGEPDGT